jgi:2-polyprenyl-6-methoxyphenol hydroxylase-like FAD-dependent oxidoreductase
VIPTNGGQSCVFVCAEPGRLDLRAVTTMSDVITSIAPEIGERLASATAPDRARSFAGRPGVIRRSWGPGWALVGDAGYWKDPISAHGLSDALRDAELLARAVIGSARPAERLEALADYQATRDRLSADLFDVTERVASLTWTNAEIGQILIELSAAMSEEVELLAGLDEPTSEEAEAVA